MKYMVAFCSPKGCQATVLEAARQAREANAELVLVRVIADPKRVGIVAELIATGEPILRAQRQVDDVVANLRSFGVNASGHVRIDDVGPGIIREANELKAEKIFLGAKNFGSKKSIWPWRHPTRTYVLKKSRIPICLVQESAPAVHAFGKQAARPVRRTFGQEFLQPHWS
jgi:Universal stress protein family